MYIKMRTLGIIIVPLLMLAMQVSSSSTTSPGESNKPYTIEFNKYHNYIEMENFLRETSMRYPNLTSLYSIGKSSQGRELWAMVISHSPSEHVLGQPDVKYVANIRGNEPVGRELLLYFIHHLVTNYNSDAEITGMLNSMRIHILPSIDPDGFETAVEGDCRGVNSSKNGHVRDLDGNFLLLYANNIKTEVETRAIEEWLAKNRFVLSGSFSGEGIVANYLCNIIPINQIASSSTCPDDDVFQHLARVYSNNHAKMYQGVNCSHQEHQEHRGSMQEYNYVEHGCMEVTLEVSCCKYPPAAELQQFWNDNRVAMIKYLNEVHKGVRGFVFDDELRPVENASVIVRGRGVDSFLTSKYGEFWRILLPGSYKLLVSASGYELNETEFSVVDQQPTHINVTLQRIDGTAGGKAEEKPGKAAADCIFHKSNISILLFLFISYFLFQ